MYQFKQRYVIRICDFFVDFRVARVHQVSPPQYQVEVTVHDVDHFHGSRLTIRLLDSAFRPLRVATRGLDYIELPTTVWLGRTFTHKAQRFEQVQSKEPPIYLYLELKGHHTLVRLLDGDTAPVGTPAVGTSTQPNEKCCPDPNGFKTPTGDLANKVDLLGQRSGAAITIVGVVVSAPFDVEAKFNNTPSPPCSCGCCEYRQRVKGHSWAQYSDGSTQDLSPVMEYIELPGPVAPGSPPLVQEAPYHKANENDFVEDTIGDPLHPGKFTATPGRRKEHPVGKYEDCKFTFHDTPSSQALIGTILDNVVTFEGAIIDTCHNGDVVLGPKFWKWTYQNKIDSISAGGSVSTTPAQLPPGSAPGR